MNYREACAQLGLESDIELTDAGLKKAFKKAALKHHPDKNLHDPEAAKEVFQRISTAYEFLNHCVARGQTGLNSPRFATSDNPLFEGDGAEDGGYDYYEDHYYEEEDDADDYFDVHEMLFSAFFGGMNSGRHGGGGGGYAFSMGGNAFFVPGRSSYSHAAPNRNRTPSSGQQRNSYSSYGGGYHDSHDYDYDDGFGDDNDDDDDGYDEMFNAFAEQARRKEEARQQARQQARKREAEHAQYMAERARQAELEGRDFFESWNVKQLMGECKRRGIATRGKQQKGIIEALIQDEAKKRLRTQLKEEAPLLDEWAEVFQMKKNAQSWNGMKVRVIDFYGDLGMYVVEWDMNASKKKTKGYMRESKTARIKPENLRLWGTGTVDATSGDGETSAAASTGSDKENSKQHQQQQQQTGKKSKTNKSSSDTTSNSNDNKKASSAKANQATEPAAPKTQSKCCAICYKEHTLEGASDNESNANNTNGDDVTEKKTMTIVLPCAHIFCTDCCGGSYLPDVTSTVEIRSCRVCHKSDPGVEALKTLPYVADLQDPPEALLEALYNEYSLKITCESVEALEKQQEKEVKAMDLQKAKTLKEQKDAIHNKASNGKMNKDKKGKLYKQVQASVEAEYEPKRKELLRTHEQQWLSVATTETLKELNVRRDAAAEEATNVISKHYRRASIKVHPDRHGDKFQNEFDALTKAKNTLSNVELRHNYMEQMLQIVSTVGTHWVASSHKSWVEKHQPDMAEQTPSTKKSDASGNSAPLQIEGGLMHTKPRKPTVAVLNAKERRIRVTLRVPGSSYEFNSYATALHIMGERSDVYTEELEEEEYSKTIYRQAFNCHCKFEGELEIDLTLPEAGMWDIRWMYTIETEPGSTHDSARSADAAVDLVSPKFKAQLKLMTSFESVATRRASEIYAALRKLTTTTGDQSTIQSRYDTLQEATLRAKHAEHHLEKVMQSVGANMKAADSPLSVLRSALTDTRSYKEELDKAMAIHEKKVAYKNFKQGVYDVLETGDGSAWVATVTEETLKDEMKGDANRLYQLLMEGKKAYNLDLVDAATLCVAADRKDLFSTKQLKALCERSEIVEIRAAEEARRMMIDIEKKESVEKALQSLQQRAALMDCERGDLVQIAGLKSEPTLNGRLATYMGLGQGERFNLLLDEGREIALRKHNFRKYDGVSVANYGPTPVIKVERWACTACTYLHEGPHVDRLSSCSVCGSSRDDQVKANEKGLPSLQPSPMVELEKEEVAKACLQQGSQRPPQKAMPQSPKKQTNMATQQTETRNTQTKVNTQQASKTSTVEASTKQTYVTAGPGSEALHTGTAVGPKKHVAALSGAKALHTGTSVGPKKNVSAGPGAKALHTTTSVGPKKNVTAGPGAKALHTTTSVGPKQAKQQGIDLAQYVSTPERQVSQSARQRNAALQSHTYRPSETVKQTPPRKNHPIEHDSAQQSPMAAKDPVPNLPVTPSRGPPNANTKSSGAAVKSKKTEKASKSLGAAAKPKKTKKPCNRGIHCRFLKKGYCHYAHTAEEIAEVKGRVAPSAKKAAHPKQAPATPTTVAESLGTYRERAVPGASSTGSINKTILVDKKAASFVMGSSAFYLKQFSERSGATITASKKDSTRDGKCHIHICGPSQEIIDRAAALIHERVDLFKNGRDVASRKKSSAKASTLAHQSKTFENGRDVTSTENSSISTVPSVINGAPHHARTAKVTAATSSSKSDLQAFLSSHQTSIKCSPDKFLNWLQEEDVETMSDLCDAIEDEYFVEELLRAGLKRFKLVAFLESLKTMLGKS